MSNGTIKPPLNSVANYVLQHTLDETETRLQQSEADVIRLSTRQRATDAKLEAIEAIASYPVKGLIRQARKVLRGDRER